MDTLEPDKLEAANRRGQTNEDTPEQKLGTKAPKEPAPKGLSPMDKALESIMAKRRCGLKTDLKAPRL